MNQFKFGEYVQVDGKRGKGVLTDKVEYQNNTKLYFVFFDDGDMGWFAEDELKPVPHPDTARLDFLISKGESAFKQNEVGDWAVFDPHSHSQLVDAKWSGFGGNPRAAIDAAMQQSD